MPMYEYQCQTCGTKFTQYVSLAKRDEPQTCPNCGSKESERLVSVISAWGGSSGCSGGSGYFT